MAAGTVGVRGDGQRFIVPAKIARESLFRLIHNLVVPRLASRRFEKYFAAKIGDTITVKRPYQAQIFRTRAITASNISPMIDRSVTIQVNKRAGFALRYNDEERTLDIVDFGDRYLQTGVEEMAYEYDDVGAEELGYGFHYNDGTPGTGLSTATAHAIGAHARHVAIPLNSMNVSLLDPLELANISEALIKNVQNEQIVGQAVRQRFRGMLANWQCFEVVTLPYLDVAASPGTPLVMGANQRGSTIASDGWTASAQVLNKGQLISFNPGAGIPRIEEIQPRGKRRTTGRDKTFTVTADVTSSSGGVAMIPIEPELNDGMLTTTDEDGTSVSLAAFKNVTRVPPDNCPIAIVGTAGKSYRQGVWYERSALEYVMIQLESFESAGLQGMATEPNTGLSVRMLGDLDILNARETRRLDAMFGAKNIYSELGIRSVGAEV